MSGIDIIENIVSYRYDIGKSQLIKYINEQIGFLYKNI